MHNYNHVFDLISVDMLHELKFLYFEIANYLYFHFSEYIKILSDIFFKLINIFKF